jgi:argininosuccinate lyase
MIDTLSVLLPAFTGMVETMTFNTQRLEELAPAGFSLATDVAEWLVKQKVVFRDAHEITGQLVSYCEQHSLELHEVPDAEMAKISKHLTPEVRDVLTVQGSIRARSGAGGTALPRVIEQLSALRKIAGEYLS